MKKAYIYIRTATVNMDNNQFDMQLKKCLDGARLNELNVVKVFQDIGVVGTTVNRRALKAMIGECITGEVEAIIVSGYDRLSRSVSDILLLKEVFKIFKTNLICLNIE